MTFKSKVFHAKTGDSSRLYATDDAQPTPSKVTDFKKDLAAATAAESHPAVQAAVHKWFPDCLAIHRAHTQNDRIGVDFWIERPMAKMVAIDAKVRSTDYQAKNGGPMDAALEINYGNAPGWAMKASATQVYLFVCTDTGRSHAFDAVLLRQALTENLPDWRNRYKVFKTLTANERGESVPSEAVCIPVTVLDAACKAIRARSAVAA